MVLLSLIGRLPFIELVPSLVGLFDVLLDECFVIRVAFFELGENKVEALSLCYLFFACLSF